MVKNFILSLIIFLYASISFANISFNKRQYTDSTELKRELVVKVAESFVGIEEIPQNKGFDNPSFERMMKLVGWLPSQAWCSYAVKLVFKLVDIPTTITGWSPSSYNRNNVVYTDGKFQKKPLKADVVSFTYQKFKKDKSRFKGIGHTGILLSMQTDAIVTAEGNTSEDNSTIQREGDVCAKKIRPLTSNVHITRWIGK